MKVLYLCLERKKDRKKEKTIERKKVKTSHVLPTKSTTFSATKYPVKITTAVPNPGKGFFHKLERRGCFRQASKYCHLYDITYKSEIKCD